MCDCPQLAMVCVIRVLDFQSGGSGFLHFRMGTLAIVAVPPALPLMLAAPLWQVLCGATGLDQKVL